MSLTDRIRCRLPSVLFALALLCGAARADWPNFRGPRFDGVSDEKGLLTSTDGPPKKLWERQIGDAFSSFAAVGNRLYTCGMADKQQVLYCLDADSGEVVWKKPFEKEFLNEHGNGTRATPTVADGKVYVLGARGRLLCANAENGEVVWEKQFNNAPTWAYSSSVLIEGDLAVSSGGKSDGALVAFDRATGKERWKTGSDPAGYATPYPFTFDGKRFIAGFNGKSLLVVHAQDGREALRHEWETDWQVNAAMPIFHDGHLFVSSGYRTGAALFQLEAAGDKLTAREVWKNKVLLSKFQSSILHEGLLYTSDEKGLKCVEFLTGTERWKQPRVANGTLVLADSFLYLLTEDGELRVGRASPEKFEPSTSVSILDGRCWSVPVIHRGRLYARNLERVVCLDIRK